MPAGRPSIYTLKCPVAGEVRYVGKANNPSKRLKQHISDSKRSNSPKDVWIRSLIASGHAPVVEVLCESQDWQADERAYIAKLSVSGRLLNRASGGVPSWIDRSATDSELHHKVVGRFISLARTSGAAKTAIFRRIAASWRAKRLEYRNAGRASEYESLLERVFGGALA